MIQEQGVLPIGMMFDGVLRREFILRPLKVKDTFSAETSADAGRFKDTNLFGLYLLGRRLTIAGIPRDIVGLDFMLDLYDDDLAEIMAADARLANAISSFRGKPEAAPQAGAGADEDGLFRG